MELLWPPFAEDVCCYAPVDCAWPDAPAAPRSDLNVPIVCGIAGRAKPAGIPPWSDWRTAQGHRTENSHEPQNFEQGTAACRRTRGIERNFCNFAMRSSSFAILRFIAGVNPLSRAHLSRRTRAWCTIDYPSCRTSTCVASPANRWLQPGRQDLHNRDRRRVRYDRYKVTCHGRSPDQQLVHRGRCGLSARHDVDCRRERLQFRAVLPSTPRRSPCCCSTRAT